MTAALKAVFYSEFDNVQGPKILYQAPENFLQPEEFDGVSDYVITGKQLCGKLVTVNAFGFKIMGYPLAIKNTKYDRNNLLFNVGFVFDEDADTDPYHAPLRKIGLTLYSMEKESQFLFNLESKERLGAVLTNILAGLNGHGEVAMVLDDANMLNLKLLRIPTTRGQVWEHEVPILLQGRGLLMSLDCDLALQQVIPHIDGIKYAKKISLDAEVDIDVVKRCLRFLLYCNCIAVVDIFQYSNMYISTEFTVEFARNPGLQKQCVKFVRREGHDPVWGTALARLYCSFRPGVCVTEVLVQNAGLAEGIDHRRLRKEYMAIVKNPVENIQAVPLESNILEWHYVITGTTGSPYEGGHYHGKLRFPPEYPLKPPSLFMATPNGRFACNRRLCLSMSDFHPETWNPVWSVSTILMGLYSFMLETAPTLGSTKSSTAEKRKLAADSLAFNCRDPTFCELFPELVSLHEQRKKALRATGGRGLAHAQAGAAAVSRVSGGGRTGDKAVRGVQCVERRGGPKNGVMAAAGLGQDGEAGAGAEPALGAKEPQGGGIPWLVFFVVVATVAVCMQFFV